MNEVSNLDLLTEQIYKEGIEKAEAEAQKIIENAKKEREHILLKAKSEANHLLSDAQKKSESIQRNTKAEIRLSGEQLLSDIKNKILDIVVAKVTSPISEDLFTNPDFLKSLITELVSKWSPSEDIELQLAKMLDKTALDKLKNSIAATLPGLTIYTADNLSGGFRIAEKNGKWQMIFTDSGFAELINQHLRPHTSRLLFEK